MGITKVGKYYLSDIEWNIIKKYPDIRNSTYYEIQKYSLLDIKDDPEFSFRAVLGIENSIKEDLELSKENVENDIRRMWTAARCLAIIDLVA